MLKPSFTFFALTVIVLGLPAVPSRAEDGWVNYVIKAPVSVGQPQLIINNFLANLMAVNAQSGNAVITFRGVALPGEVYEEAGQPDAADVGGLTPLKTGVVPRGVALPGVVYEEAGQPDAADVGGLTPLKTGVVPRGVALPGVVYEEAGQPDAADVGGLTPLKTGVVPRGQSFPVVSGNSESSLIDYTVRVPSQITQVQAQRIIDNFVARFTVMSNADQGTAPQKVWKR